MLDSLKVLNVVTRIVHLRILWNLVNAAGVEPLCVFPVQSFHMGNVLAPQETQRPMKFGLSASFGAIGGVPHLIEKFLVGGGMFFESGEPVTPQKALFAAEMHLGKFHQPNQLRTEF